MKQQKIRGFKRRHRDIEKWRLANLELRLDLIEKYDYDNIDIVVHPWCDISIINSEIPEPKGKTKQLMLDGLIDIYYSWKEQLNKINQPYYLKIWLYEPRFSKSQVVCAVGNRINYYENLFINPDKIRYLKNDNFGQSKIKLDVFDWIHCLDEYQFDNNDLDESEEDRRWFNKMMKKPHRTTKIDDSTELYSFKQGYVWVGGN